MKVTCKSLTEASAVTDALKRSMHLSRFKCEYDMANKSAMQRGNWYVTLSEVRLLESRPYCGNHPAECERPHPHGHKLRKAAYLEGTDWVAFNDMVNDTLDNLGHEGNAATAICVIRTNGRRRTNYGMYRSFNQNQWEKTGHLDQDYADCRGKTAPISDYPFGTPGTYAWKKDTEG